MKEYDLTELPDILNNLSKEVFVLRIIVSALLQELPQEKQDKIMKATGFKLVPMEHD